MINTSRFGFRRQGITTTTRVNCSTGTLSTIMIHRTRLALLAQTFFSTHSLILTSIAHIKGTKIRLKVMRVTTLQM